MSLRESFLLNKTDKIINPTQEETLQQILDKVILLDSGGVSYFNKTTGAVSGIEYTILDFICPGNAKLTRFYLSGSADGLFKIKINDNEFIECRNSPAERNINMPLIGSEISLSTGDNVIITGEHKESNMQEFSATIFIQER